MTDPHEVAEAWVNRYADRVFRLAYALVGERTRAEDAAQDSLYHIARWCLYHPEFQPTDQWVHQVTRNAVRDMQRRLPPPSVPLEAYHAVDRPQEDWPERLDVAQALGRLPASDREVLVLFYYLDLTTRDMARTMNISETAVRIRLSRARRKFRVVFEHNGQGKEQEP